MGEPMLAALRDAGFDAIGFDVRAPQSYGEFADAITDDVPRFAEHLKILISVVRDIEQTEALLFETQALAAGAPGLRSIIICSTLSPRYLQGLKGRLPSQITLVDAPMSGATIAARERRLSFMMGGEEADLTALRPLFEAMGTSFHTMGPFAAGMTAKVLNNLLAASSTAMTRLVMDWAVDLGLDERSLLALIDKSSGQNWFASGFDGIEFARDGYAHDNTIGILEKDIRSALDAVPQGTDNTLPNAVITALRKLKPRS